MIVLSNIKGDVLLSEKIFNVGISKGFLDETSNKLEDIYYNAFSRTRRLWR